MKRYLKNLMKALCGNNPYQDELDRLREEFRTTAKGVKELESLYEKVSGQIGDYQKLVENLRKRLSEKNELLNRTKEEYQKRIDQYNKVISDLRAEKPANTAKPARTRKRKPKQKKDEQRD